MRRMQRAVSRAAPIGLFLVEVPYATDFGGLLEYDGPNTFIEQALCRRQATHACADDGHSG